MNPMRNLRSTLASIPLAGLVAIGAATTVSASPISIAFNTTSNNVGGPGNDNPIGEPSNTDSLMLPGQTGPWNSLIVGSGRIGEVNGQVVNIFSELRSLTVDGVTFDLNTGLNRYETFNDPSGNDDLRQAVLFVRSGGRTDLSLSWSISGLDDSKTYDLIFFGQEGGANPGAFSISGHDAGNGLGLPATLDLEADANFYGVQSSGGVISGTFALPGSGFASWSGLQIQAVPEPAGLVLLGLGLAAVAGLRRRA